MEYLISDSKKNAPSRPASVRPDMADGAFDKNRRVTPGGPSGPAGQDFSFSPGSRFVLTHGRHMVT